MPGGRPEQGKQQVHPELAELSAWLRQALADAGFASVNAFVQRHPFDKNQVYGLFKGARFLSLESTQAVAVALRRKPEEVEPLWWRAKDAMELSTLAQRDRTSDRLTSWARLPWPELALHDILEAQSRAVDQLPYRLLGVDAPPLSMVYVRQQARLQAGVKQERPDGRGDQADDKDRPDTGATDVVVEIADALNRHEHLVVTGQPGAGKSTFGQYFALRLSRIWLRQDSGADAPLHEPVIPLRISARALVGSMAWGAALAEATCQALGMRLVASPVPSLFERPAQGARWLVIIDGLDEIVDRAARGEVIEAVAAHCRPGGPYRIVLTTRELPDVEFAPLRAQHVGQYSIQPFGREQLETFATQWFAAQGVGRAEADAKAARFLRQTGDSRLRDLVRNPLLATIAAISHTLEPDRPLPTGRLELYERFFAYLVDEEASGRATLVELRRLQPDHPARYRIAEWIHQRRVELFRHLAFMRLESERPLAKLAEEWVSKHAPKRLSAKQGWEEDLRQLLIGTGLFVYEGDGLRFLHHSFAEYLAAEEHAERIGAGFPDLDSWIARGLKEADRGFVLFVFVIWGRRSGNGISVILRRLLAGNPERAMLAGRLTVEATTMPDEDAQLVLGRLVDLAIGNAMFEQSGRSTDVTGRTNLALTPVSSLMEVLGGLVDRPAVAERLAALAVHPRLPLLLRIEAAVTLGRVAGSARALMHLKPLALLAQDADLVRVARALLDQEPEDRLAENLLVQLGNDPGAHLTSRAEAARELAILGNPTAASIGQQLVRDAPVDPYALRTAVQAWLDSIEPGDRAQVVDALRQRARPLSAHHRIEACGALAEAGLRAEAHELIEPALTDADCAYWRLDEVVTAYLSTAERPDPASVLATLQDRTSPDSRAYIARGLAEAGHPVAAAELASEVVRDPRADGYDICHAASTWLSAAGESARDMVCECLSRRAEEPMALIGPVVTAIADAGKRDQAIELAKRLVADPRISHYSLQGVVAAWLGIAGPAADAQLRQFLEQRPMQGVSDCSLVAETCAEYGLTEIAVWLARRAILATPDQPFVLAVKAWIAAVGPAGAGDLLAATEERHLTANDRIAIADHFAAAGALPNAQRLWRAVLTSRDAPLEHAAIAVVRLLETDGHRAALQALTDLLDAADEPSWERRQLSPLISMISVLAADVLPHRPKAMP